MVSWAQVCKPKSAGDLGMHDLELFNVALLGKWRWRYLHDHKQLWCKVLFSKYGCGEAKKASIWWKDLVQVCVGEDVDHWFEGGLRRRVEEGDGIRFWKEDWHGGGCFQKKFS